MGHAEVIFQKPVDSFNKRFWKVYSTNFLLIIIASVLPVAFAPEINGIVVFYLAIVFSILIVGIYNSYKWSVNKIKSVTLDDDLFTIVITKNNSDQVVIIDKQDIKTKLQWKGGRPRVLKLSILDKGIAMVELYSGMKANEFELENIAYQINQNLNNKAS